jgi:hypothetical protein
MSARKYSEYCSTWYSCTKYCAKVFDDDATAIRPMLTTPTKNKTNGPFHVTGPFVKNTSLQKKEEQMGQYKA